MGKRKYRQRRRAEQQERTRARIVQATVELHEELGPARTTISAIAERAGVQRLTVYRHFPDERELFKACSSRFLELYPPPDASGRVGNLEGPNERVRHVLVSFYRYYRRTAAMWRKVYRDIELVPANAEVIREFEVWLGGIGDDLVKSYGALTGSTRRTMRRILGHALGFSTWESLDREGFSDGAKASSIVSWLDAVRDRRYRH